MEQHYRMGNRAMDRALFNEGSCLTRERNGGCLDWQLCPDIGSLHYKIIYPTVMIPVGPNCLALALKCTNPEA